MFAFTLTGGFLFVAAIGYWRDSRPVQLVALILAGLALMAGLVAPGHLEPARKAWMRLGEAIGRVTTPVLMAVVYYAVVTPTGLLRRAVTRRAAPSASAWHVRAPLPPRERMERQF